MTLAECNSFLSNVQSVACVNHNLFRRQKVIETLDTLRLLFLSKDGAANLLYRELQRDCNIENWTASKTRRFVVGTSHTV